MHLVRAAIYGVRGRAVKRANAPDDGLREAVESRFEPGQGWIASSQVLLAMTHDAALPIAKRIQLLRPLDAALLYPSTLGARTLQRCVFSAEYFPLLRGNRRFHGIGSITQLPPKSPVLSHAIHRYGARCRGFAACRPQACKIPRIEVKCLNAGPDRSATRKWPGPLLPSRRTKSAHLAAGGVAMDHKCFHRHVISVATFLAHCADFAPARCHGT
jgi:hypothetical protein